MTLKSILLGIIILAIHWVGISHSSRSSNGDLEKPLTSVNSLAHFASYQEGGFKYQPNLKTENVSVKFSGQKISDSNQVSFITWNWKHIAFLWLVSITVILSLLRYRVINII